MFCFNRKQHLFLLFGHPVAVKRAREKKVRIQNLLNADLNIRARFASFRFFNFLIKFQFIKITDIIYLF